MFAQFAKRESKNDTIFPRKIPKKKIFNNLIGINEFFRFMIFFFFEFLVLKKVKFLSPYFADHANNLGRREYLPYEISGRY